MRLYLVRHGDARPLDATRSGQDDRARPLSPRGRAEAERLAERAAHGGVRVVEIRESGLVRARQTAEILAARLAPERGVVAMAGIDPGGDADTVAHELALLAEPVLIVTHMPFVAELTGRLLGPRASPVPYGTAELRCLVREGDRWSVAFTLDGAA